MRTIKIKRDRWRTPKSGKGPRWQLLNYTGCGCIMGLIGEACGVDREEMIASGSLDKYQLSKIDIDQDLQERAIEINDRTSISDDYRESKLKELFKDHFVLEFV